MEAFAWQTALTRFDGIVSTMGAMLLNDKQCPPEAASLWPALEQAFRKQLRDHYAGPMHLLQAS